MITKAAMILNQVAVAHAMFYVLKRQDQMCYCTNTWSRNLKRMIMELPPYLRRTGHPLSRGLTILVKSHLVLMWPERGGAVITLAPKGRHLARF